MDMVLFLGMEQFVAHVHVNTISGVNARLGNTELRALVSLSESVFDNFEVRLFLDVVSEEGSPEMLMNRFLNELRRGLILIIEQ